MLRVLSRFISGVLSPYFTFIYIYALLLSSAYLSTVTLYTFGILIGVIALFTTLIPFLISKLNGINFDDKNSERGALYLAFVIGNSALAYYLISRGIALWRISFLISAVFAIITLFLINRKYNVSFHTTMFGVLTGAVFIIAKFQSYISIEFIATIILLAGALGSARVYLKGYTPGEVITGTILGFSWSYIGAIFTKLFF